MLLSGFVEAVSSENTTFPLSDSETSHFEKQISPALFPIRNCTIAGMSFGASNSSSVSLQTSAFFSSGWFRLSEQPPATHTMRLRNGFPFSVMKGAPLKLSTLYCVSDAAAESAMPAAANNAMYVFLICIV